MPIGTRQLGDRLGLATRRSARSAASLGQPAARRAEREQRLRARGGDQEADRAGEAGRAIVVPCEPDRRRRSANSRPRLAKIASPAAATNGMFEQVRLAQPQQQAGDRQHRDRQHQRAAERLQRLSDERMVMAPPLRRLRASARTARRRERSASASAASARQAARSRRADQRLGLGIAAGGTDSSVTPRPIRIGDGAGIAGEAAADAGRPAVRASRPRTVSAISRRTAGSSPSSPAASAGWPRSIASAYWRQVVGADREEVGLLGERSAIIAAAGVSTMTPSSGAASASSAPRPIERCAHGAQLGERRRPSAP